MLQPKISIMHRLLSGVVLIGAVIIGAALVSGLLVGCGWRKKQDSPSGEQSVATSSSSAQTAPAVAPTTGPVAVQPPVQDAQEPVSPTANNQATTEHAADAASASASPRSTSQVAAAADDVGTSQAVPEPTWSTQRLVVLAPGGPRLIDLRINVEGNDLATGLTEATERLASQLEFHFDAPISWDELLEKPLVKSGWFGNLVPTAEQRAELLSMYDKDNSATVDASEFQAFVTRGLSRRDQVRLAQARAPMQLARASSPWGPLDQDANGELSEEELGAAADALMRFDFDGDGIISEGELRSASETTAGGGNMPRSDGLLDLALVLTIDPKQPTALDRAVHEHYTFADTIPRDVFPHWDDRRWSKLDTEGKGEITKRDLAHLHGLTADAQVDVTLPNSVGEKTDTSDAAVNGTTGPDAGQTTWRGGSRGGRLTLPGCVVLVQLRDDHGWTARRIACQQLAKAADDPQLAAGLAAALELKEGAWDLMRERGQEGADGAWRWLAGPRHFHLTASWRVVETPWFELIDGDADRRLTSDELSQFRQTSKPWDQNLDGKLEVEELPLVISLELAREDRRLAGLLSGGTNMEKGGTTDPSAPSWFTAMDYNSDGGVTHAEFLGEDSAFEALDADADGIIVLREVYAPH